MRSRSGIILDMAVLINKGGKPAVASILIVEDSPTSREYLVTTLEHAGHRLHQAKDGSERLVVHLFSDLNTTAFHALPGDDVPLREEVVPIPRASARIPQVIVCQAFAI